MNAVVHFSIKYDGPALATHQMDVRELAPALIALSSMLEEANRALYSDSAEVRVNVNGSFNLETAVDRYPPLASQYDH